MTSTNDTRNRAQLLRGGSAVVLLHLSRRAREAMQLSNALLSLVNGAPLLSCQTD